ncbi:MAG: nucleotidyltransferase domain-containing protein [Terracidiphilus sp.]
MQSSAPRAAHNPANPWRWHNLKIRLHCSKKDRSYLLLQLQYTFTAMLSLRSELRRKVLTFFYMNRKRRVYVRQLAAELDADSTNISRELARLAREGFLNAEREGRQLYYSVNHAYPYLKPVFALLHGSVGIEPTLKRALEPVAGIASAWIFGSFAKDEADAASDIDLLIVGKPDQVLLSREIRKAEKAVHREVSYTVFTPHELNRRLARRDPFVTDIWNGKRIGLIQDGNDKTAEGRSQASKAIPG